MRFIERGAFSAIVLLGCHAGQPTSVHRTASRTPAPCRGGVGNAISVDHALAITERRDVVTVEGYLVRVPGPCTLMGCAGLVNAGEDVPDCNVCEIDVRIAASRAPQSKTIRLFDLRGSYRCLNKQDTCAFAAIGEHVLARGAFSYSENDIERVALHNPEICELSP